MEVLNWISSEKQMMCLQAKEKETAAMGTSDLATQDTTLTL
jgi:hypothetical protein